MSQVEQEISAKNEKSLHFKKIVKLLEEESIPTYEKLRLVSLYALKYESEVKKVKELKGILR